MTGKRRSLILTLLTALVAIYSLTPLAWLVINATKTQDFKNKEEILYACHDYSLDVLLGRPAGQQLRDDAAWQVLQVPVRGVRGPPRRRRDPAEEGRVVGEHHPVGVAPLEQGDRPVQYGVLLLEFGTDDEAIASVDEAGTLEGRSPGATRVRLVDEASGVEQVYWERAWRTPQACAWAMPSEAWRARTVAMWARLSVRCEDAEAPAALGDREGRVVAVNAGLCDVVMGVPSSVELAATTRPYYRSGYVFVTRRDRHLRIRSLDDPRLRRLSIGLHVIGDDYASVPLSERPLMHDRAAALFDRGPRVAARVEEQVDGRVLPLVELADRSPPAGGVLRRRYSMGAG